MKSPLICRVELDDGTVLENLLYQTEDVLPPVGSSLTHFAPVTLCVTHVEFNGSSGAITLHVAADRGAPEELKTAEAFEAEGWEIVE